MGMEAYHHSNNRNQKDNLNQPVKDEEETSNHFACLAVHCYVDPKSRNAGIQPSLVSRSRTRRSHQLQSLIAIQPISQSNDKKSLERFVVVSLYTDNRCLSSPLPVIRRP